MFERFTERARQVIVLAQDSTRELKHNYIGTEHMILGLIREEQGLAARALSSLGVAQAVYEEELVRRVGRGNEVTTGQIPFTPRAKKTMELALREALSLGHNYIGTEHLLLGVLREGEGVGNLILLEKFSLSSDAIRAEVMRLLGPPAQPTRKTEWKTEVPVYTIHANETHVLERETRGIRQVVATGTLFGDGRIRWSFNSELKLSSEEIVSIIREHLEPFEATEPGRFKIPEPPSEWPGIEPHLKDLAAEIWTAGRDAAVEVFTKNWQGR